MGNRGKRKSELQFAMAGRVYSRNELSGRVKEAQHKFVKEPGVTKTPFKV